MHQKYRIKKKGETIARSRAVKLFLLAVIILSALMTVFIGVSNRILKYTLEKRLGENFAVEQISLGWNKVEATGVRIQSEGKLVASARKLVLRANPLMLLRKNHSVSSLILEEPWADLQVAENGRLKLPFSDREPKHSDGTAPRPLLIKHIHINNGSFSFHGSTGKWPASMEGKDLNIDLYDFSLPFQNSQSRIRLEGVVAGETLAGSIRLSGNVNFGARGGNIECEARDISLFGVKGQETQARAESINFKAFSRSLPVDPLVLTDVTAKGTFYRLIINRKGDVINPVTKKPIGQGRSQDDKLRVHFKNSTLSKGEFDYVDEKISHRPHTVKIRDIELRMDSFAIPFEDVVSSYDVAGKVSGKQGAGLLRINGKTSFKTKDGNAKISLQNLDIALLKPYIEKKGDAEVIRGTLDLKMSLSVAKRRVYAPTQTVIRDLQFAPGRHLGDRFMGVPRAAVVKMLKTSRDEISLDFVVEGSLDNPKFSFQESLIKRFAIGLAEKMGLSVFRVGETAIIQGGKILKHIGKGLQNIIR
jgi:hypothetical protein